MRRFPRIVWPFVSRRFQRSPRVVLPVHIFKWQPVVPLGWVALVLFLVIMAVVGGIIWRSQLLIVTHVVVEEEVPIQPAVVPITSLNTQAKTYKGRLLPAVSEDSVSGDFLKKFPSLDHIQVKHLYPQTLSISYQQRVPVCVIVTEKGSYLVDRSGFIFAQGQSPHLIQLYASGVQAKVGSRISTRGISLGLGLINGLRLGSSRIVKVELEANQLRVSLSQPPTILINDDRSTAEALQTITTLFDYFTAQNKTPRELDLRFERPIFRD